MKWSNSFETSTISWYLLPLSDGAFSVGFLGFSVGFYTDFVWVRGSISGRAKGRFCDSERGPEHGF